ncbi:uncharacterized protein UDID_18915 [Ustilago sp. UG-2017a]|nr:uncharacterized protein UDID_18915 [Ustilago sp. UG-2017a]
MMLRTSHVAPLDFALLAADRAVPQRSHFSEQRTECIRIVPRLSIFPTQRKLTTDIAPTLTEARRPDQQSKGKANNLVVAASMLRGSFNRHAQIRQR